MGGSENTEGRIWNKSYSPRITPAVETHLQLLRLCMWNLAWTTYLLYSVNTASVKYQCMPRSSGKQSWESKNHTMVCKGQNNNNKKHQKKGSSSSWSCSSCFGSVFGIQAIQNSHYSLRISVHNICRYTNQRQQNQMGSISNPWNRMRLHLPKTVSQISPFIMWTWKTELQQEAK